MIRNKIKIPAPAGASPGKRRFSFSRAERRVMRRRKHINGSMWAERHRWLKQSVISGPWSNKVMPQLVGVMDAAVLPYVRSTILCKSVQSGGSEAVHNVVGRGIDREPGPVMYLYPDKNTGQENAKDRILLMILDSPALSRYVTGNPDDLSQIRIKLQHVVIYIAWAHSPASMANKPCRYVVMDETDKYPPVASKTEADPCSLAEKRVTTYRRAGKSKVFKLSTPSVESGEIWRAFTTEAQARFDYWVKCPVCGGYQLMEFDRIRVPEGERDPERIEAERMAWYDCAHCPAKWDDAVRDAAVRAGEWRERETGEEMFLFLDRVKPHKIGFHLPAWISYFVTLSECVAAFFRGLKDKNKLKDFMNNYKAEPWRSFEKPRTEDALLQLRDDRPAGIVPGGGVVAALTAGVDTQDNGFWYEVRAWGFGPERESWQVRAGFVETFDGVEEILWRSRYADPAGREYFVRLAVQDAMGHRTDAVYSFCRTHRGRILAFKGEQRMAQPYGFSQVDFYPGTKRPIPGGLKLLRADVNYFKNILSQKLEINPADPGAWHFNAEVSTAWCRQMTEEYIDDKTGLWVCPDGHPNHAWDCSVYSLIAADVLGVRYWPKEAPPPPAAQAQAAAINPYTGRAAGSFYGGSR